MLRKLQHGAMTPMKKGAASPSCYYPHAMESMGKFRK